MPFNQNVSIPSNGENREALDVILRWKRSGVNVSDRICKLVIQPGRREEAKAFEETEKQKEQQVGAPAANHNDAFLQQAEYDNNFASPLDNILRANLHEAKLTEAQLNPLNDEQAIELYKMINKSQSMIKENSRIVRDFFDIVNVYDEAKKDFVPTIQNTEYERRLVEQEAFLKQQEEENRRRIEREAEEESGK